MSDHHYERSTGNSAVDAVPQEDLDIAQEKAKREPLPDGTIPPNESPINTSPADPQSFSTRPITESNQDPLETVSPQEGLKVASSRRTTIPEPKAASTGLSSEEARILQRQSESQIPARPAEPPEASEFGVEQEQDVFYQPPGTTSPVLSALPRIRVPKVEWDVQGGDPHIPGGTNPDVYYSGRESAPVSGDEPTEEMLSQLFQSSKVSRILGAKEKPSSRGARAFHTTSRRQKSSVNETEEFEKLADDMAKDVHTSDAVSSTGMQSQQWSY